MVWAMARPSSVSDDRMLLNSAGLSWDDVLFEEARARRPWKKVLLAVFLFIAGISMLSAGLGVWYNGGAGDGSGVAPLCARAFAAAACHPHPSARKFLPTVSYFVVMRSHAATALLVLGSLCFVPGAYHTRIAYLAWRGVPGYTLDAIPDL